MTLAEKLDLGAARYTTGVRGNRDVAITADDLHVAAERLRVLDRICEAMCGQPYPGPFGDIVPYVKNESEGRALAQKTVEALGGAIDGLIVACEMGRMHEHESGNSGYNQLLWEAAFHLQDMARRARIDTDLGLKRVIDALRTKGEAEFAAVQKARAIHDAVAVLCLEGR